MRLSTKGHHAMLAMLDLARHQPAGPVTLQSISLRQKVSLSYLEQLFARLRACELVDSQRGPGGGYTLARDPLDISVADIVTAVDGEPAGSPESVSPRPAHDFDVRLITERLWAGMDACALEYLRSVSLARLLVRVGEIDPSHVPSNPWLQRRRAGHDQPGATRPAVRPHQA